MRIVKNCLVKFKRSFFPSQRDKAIKKWWADGGDYKLRFDYDLNSESWVFFYGGVLGQGASELFSRYQCRILVFEPVKRFAQQIDERFRKNSKIEVFNFGLGGSTRSERIAVCADGSSVFVESKEREQILVMDILEWLSTRDEDNFDLLKINIEGGEYELLERIIACDLASKIDSIQVQFHNIAEDSEQRMQRILSVLSRTHMPTYQYRFVWENWKRR
jgi:FkbM family methyltransferase